MSDQIEIGDSVVVILSSGLRVEGKVVALLEEHGLPVYRVVTKDFVLMVTKSQIAEVHK